MTADTAINRLTEAFGPGIIDSSVRNPRRAIVTISSQLLVNIAEFLNSEAGFRFIIASALLTKKGFEIHYHFSMDTAGLILNLHVILDRDKPEIESLSNMFNASNWIEREMHELFGINFRNHPNQEKLISEGNWAEGVYPMKKDLN